MSKKQQLGEIKTSAEVDNLFRFIFRHLVNIPADKIEEAVILVSYTDETAKVFKELEGQQRPANEYNQTLMCEMQDKTKVIYSTEALLSPELGHNFFTINYIFKTVKRAKIMLVFSHNDVKAPGMKNIKEALQRFVAIFEDKKGLGKTLAESCGIIITNSDNQMSKDNYLRYLQKIYDEPKFIKQHNVKELVKELVDRQKIVLFNNKNNNPQQFTKFVAQLPCLNLPGMIDIKLQTSIEAFKSNNLESNWINRFKFLYESIQDMIKGQALEIQAKLTNEISNQTGLKYVEKMARNIDENIAKVKSFPLFQLVLNLLKTFKSVFEFLVFQTYDQKLFVKNILNALYRSKYLTQDLVQFYLLAYFEIFRCLSVNGAESVSFQKITFVQQAVGDISRTNSLLRSCLVLIEENIHDELQKCDKKYPFDLAINYIRSILEVVSAIKVLNQNGSGNKWDNKLTFWTSRMEKKLLKYQCEFQYKKTVFLSKEYGISKITYRESWIDFITMAQNSTLIDPAKIEEGVMFLADELVKEKVYQQALKVYQLMPEYLALNQIIDIYSFKFKIHPDFLKYTFFDNLNENIKHLHDYCGFLLKIGFNQKVRELCYQGLRAMTNKKDRNTEQVFNNLLIKARSESSQNIHNEFLQRSILKERIVKIDNILLQEIRDKFKSFDE